MALVTLQRSVLETPLHVPQIPLRQLPLYAVLQMVLVMSPNFVLETALNVLVIVYKTKVWFAEITMCQARL
jgi:hypothetical protein